jgi:putative restriction endonuclease
MSSNNTNVPRRRWTREEIILAFELYCTLPASKINTSTAQIIGLSHAMNHSVGSVKAMMENFKSFDPSYTRDGKVGLGHGSRLAEEVAKEFIDNWDDLVVESERIKRKYDFELLSEPPAAEAMIMEGVDVERVVKVRCGQAFFRKSLLANYEGECCISGIAIEDLLKASHIKPWSKSNDMNEKANPQNGLLLNALLDSAFDKGYFTIDPEDYKVVLSRKIRDHADKCSISYFELYEGRPITLPKRFLPGKPFIEYHNDHVFMK